MLLDKFPELPSMKVLDLGGRPSGWSAAPVRPAHVVSLNLAGQQLAPREDWFEVVEGDACDPPSEVMSQTFDLVYSNSVIEHVGGPANERRFADVVSNLAPHCWVQTPYRYFPIEPHWLFPWFQLLPVRAKALVGLRWPLSNFRPIDARDAIEDALSVRLLSRTEFAFYFPDCEIIGERVLGLTKSLIAFR
jgi:hypothetical protein